MVEKFYCRYEGDYSQRHLEESKLNWAMRKWEVWEWKRREEENERRGQKRGRKGKGREKIERAKRMKRTHISRERSHEENQGNAWLKRQAYEGMRSWGRQVKPLGYRGLGWGWEEKSWEKPQVLFEPRDQTCALTCLWMPQLANVIGVFGIWQIAFSTVIRFIYFGSGFQRV